MKKRIFAVLLAAALLAGCSGSGNNSEKTEELKNRITAVDTELATMYGKLSDMHEKGIIDDDFFNKFTALDAEADECMNYAESTGVKASELEKKVNALSGDFNAFKAELDSINEQNETAVMQELIVVQLAAKEQGGLMKRALESGKITQEEYDEFVNLQKQVDYYNAQTDLEYSDEFREEFSQIRSRLTALASKAGADNALIDRLMGTENTVSEESTEEGTAAEADIKTAEAGEIETQKQEEEPKKELPDNLKTLINDYNDLQEFVSQKQAAGEITDLDYIDVLGTGVELAYLKEAVEKDGVTENNTYTMQDIKAELYAKAQGVGYDKAEVFK